MYCWPSQIPAFNSNTIQNVSERYVQGARASGCIFTGLCERALLVGM
jgi:hypothetical protein